MGKARERRKIRRFTRPDGRCPACRVVAKGPGRKVYRAVVCGWCGTGFYLGRNPREKDLLGVPRQEKDPPHESPPV